MKSEFLNQILSTIEAEVRSRPSAMEFEMAYQTRIAIDRIKCTVQTEQAGGRPDQIREAGMLLLDALDRLDSFERQFQQTFAIHALGPQREPKWHSGMTVARQPLLTPAVG